MQLKMTFIGGIFNKIGLSTSSSKPRTAHRLPACGCLPVLGGRKIRKLSRSINNLQADQDKLQSGIDNLTLYQATEQEVMRANRSDLICQRLTLYQATEQEVMRANRSDLICQRQKLQQQVEHLQQQLDGADGVIVEIKVLPDSYVKCLITAVNLQPAQQPADDNVVARTERSGPLGEMALENTEPLIAESRVEPAGQDACSSSELDMTYLDAKCDVVLVETITGSKHAQLGVVKPEGIRTYSSKLASWCKKALVISDVTDTTSSDIANKVSSRWRGSSNDGRRSSLLEWGSALTSFRKSSSVSSG